MMILFFACSSNYGLNNVSEKAPLGGEEEITTETEEAVVEEESTEEIEETEEQEPEEIEEIETEEREPEEPEPDYCTPFDDFSEWNYFGDGNWHINNNLLYENQGGFYATTAYLYDFGQSISYSMEVNAFWEGSLNDLSGFVFNLDPNTGRYWTANIDDPQGDYSRYNPNGAIVISRCLWDNCTVIAQDSSTHMMANVGEVVNLKLDITNSWVSFYWNGQLAFSQEVPNAQGPGIVGLYSNDNDGGVIYDDFCIYVD